MKKRIISLGLSLAMVLTSANSIFAATTTITGTPTGNSLPYTSSKATGDGSLTYLDKDVTIVTLPTDDLNFSMDPQGIIGATKAVAADASLADDAAKQSAFTNALSTYAGRIYGDNILTIKNEGANEVEVGVSVVAKVTRDGGEAQKTKLKTNNTATTRLADTDVTPNTGDPGEKDNIISLDVAYTGYKEDTPGNANEANKGPVEFAEKAKPSAEGKRVLGFDPFEASKDTIAGYAGFDKAGSQITFQFDEDITYGIKYSDAGGGTPTVAVASGVANTEPAKANKTKGVTVGFAISGRLNKNADWSDYTGASPKEKIDVTAIYNVAPISGGNETVVKTSERTGASVPVDTKCGKDATISAISGASISSPTVNDLASNIDLTFTPSVMDSSVALNSAVAPTINGTAITIGRYNTAADYYVFNGNTLTMKPLAFTTVGATGTCTVEVKGTDGNPYTSTITVTAP